MIYNSVFVPSPPRSREVLTVVCLIIAPFSSRPPPRQAGGTTEVFDGGFPYYSVCVSFNYFASRFS